MEPAVKRMLGLAVALGCGLGMMIGAGVWVTFGGSSAEQIMAGARRLGMVTAAEAAAGEGVLLVVSGRSDATDVAEALRAAGLREQAAGFVLRATGRRLAPGAYWISQTDSLEEIVERLTARP